jgi:hypothetical protein
MFGNRLIKSLKFPAGVLVGILMFSGSAMAFNNYVADNTPANGYLLCANNKTKAVTFPNKLSCPPGTRALDLGAVTGQEGPQGPQGPAGQTATAKRPKNGITTFASVSLPASTSNYSAILPLREKAFSASNTWHHVRVRIIISGVQDSGIVKCQVMPMDRFTGTQSLSTTVNSNFIILPKISLTQEFSGDFVYQGGDYILACRSEVAATVNASAVVQESDAITYLN